MRRQAIRKDLVPNELSPIRPDPIWYQILAP